MGWHGKSKYKSVKVECDGHIFPSKLEHRRYLALKTLMGAGEIRDLELQPKFPCRVNGILICTYIADFRYLEKGIEVVEDAKGLRLPLFNLKLKLVKALYPGINIVLVNAR